MNNQNLIPNIERSPEELREMGRKGGIKSGEIRRKKRDIQKALKWMMDDSLGDILKDLAEWYGGFLDDQ